MSDFVTLVSSLGFPIVACIFTGYYVKYQADNYRSELKDMQKEHRDEISKVTDALQNNTLALQKLCDKLDKDVDDIK